MTKYARWWIAGALVAIAASASSAQTPKAPSSGPTVAKIRKTEIIAADNWTITCTTLDRPNAKRRCSAELRIVQTENGASRAVFSWTIGEAEGKPTSVVSTPTGVLIGPGVEFRLSGKELRKIDYQSCVPDHCEAVVPLDERTTRALEAAPTVDFLVTGMNGSVATFTVNLKGFEEAMAAISK